MQTEQNIQAGERTQSMNAVLSANVGKLVQVCNMTDGAVLFEFVGRLEFDPDEEPQFPYTIRIKPDDAFGAHTFSLKTKAVESMEKLSTGMLRLNLWTL